MYVEINLSSFPAIIDLECKATSLLRSTCWPLGCLSYSITDVYTKYIYKALNSVCYVYFI